MTKQIVSTTEAPQSGLFSQAVKAGNLVFLSGIVGTDPKSNQLAGVTIGEQTRQSLRNCESILKAAGASLTDVVDVHVLLARPGDFGGFNDEYLKFFPSEPPARSVGRLGPEIPNLLVSIKMIAALPG